MSTRSAQAQLQEEGHCEDREESGMSCSSLESVPGGRDVPIHFPKRSGSISPQAEKSTLSFLGIHCGVCLWVFLFKTIIVGTNQEEPSRNKIRTRN